MTLHRTHDPDTSVEAAARIEPHLTRIQEDVLALHREAGAKGLTQSELEIKAGWWGYPYGKSTLRTRRSELEREGMIERTDEKRVNSTGGREAVYVAKEGKE